MSLGLKFETLEESGWEPVIMIGTVGLHVGVVGIETQDNGAAEGFVVPVG